MRCGEHEVTRTIDKSGLALCVRAPEHEDDGLRLLVDRPDYGVGEALPAPALVRGRAATLDGQHAVQKQHALARPAFEEAVARRRNTQVFLQFLVDVDE